LFLFYAPGKNLPGKICIFAAKKSADLSAGNNIKRNNAGQNNEITYKAKKVGWSTVKYPDNLQYLLAL